jgi:hypothetical protein
MNCIVEAEESLTFRYFKAFNLILKLLASAYFPVRIKVSVKEPSDAVKRRNG